MQEWKCIEQRWPCVRQERDVKMLKVEAMQEQKKIMLTTLQNQMLQHQQTMELQMKQFELKLKKRDYGK
jgi:hypothetical protein